MEAIPELQILPTYIVNRKFPHQVIIPAKKVGVEHRRFADANGLTLCAQVGRVYIQDRPYRVFCFHTRDDARAFAARFEGIRYLAARANPVAMIPVLGTVR